LCAEKEKFLPLRFYIVIIDKWFCCYATFILCSWLRVFLEDFISAFHMA
jgi:hypothetical protein